MRPPTKICSMCRENVDAAAVICPHCRNNTDYRSFLEIEPRYIVQKRSPVIRVLAFIVVTALAGGGMMVGFLFGGFWIAVGAFIIIFAAGFGCMEIMGIEGFDQTLLTCPGCSHQENIQWSPKKYEEYKSLSWACPTCGYKLHFAPGITQQIPPIVSTPGDSK